MKRFEFSLQYLADLHAARQQEAEQALSSALRKQADAQSLLMLLIDRRNRMVREVEQLTGCMKRTEWSEKIRYLQEFERQLGECRQAVDTARAVVQTCRDRLNEELKECRIIEKIEKGERARWAESVRQEEQKQMDELAAGRWFRQEVMES